MAISKKNLKQKTDISFIPEKYQHAAAATVIFLSMIIFYNQIIFEGKVFNAADNIASKSFVTLVSDAEKEGIFPLWNPYIFCGMPGYASLSVHGERYFDITVLLLNRTHIVFGYLMNNPEIGWQLLYYLLLGLGVYFFAYEKTKNKIASLIAGLGVLHSTFIAILIMVGHMTKIPVIAFFPWIFLILERLRFKFSLWLSLLLVVLIHFMILPSHMQMIFYVYFALMIYYIFFFIRTVIVKEDWKGVLRSASILVIATGIAFAMTGDQYFSTLEYSKYSMRGSDPIVPSAQAIQKGATNGGLDYDYATQWSFSPGEMLSFIIPSSHGFGWHEYSGMLTQSRPMRLNTYFGPSPFTDAPQYMGVVILALALIGFWKNKKDSFVQYTAITIFVAVIISFGKEFSLLYDVMFNYFPMFNKFRIPSMSLILVQILIPVLAAYGVSSLLNGINNESEKKNWFYAVGVFAIAFLISMVAKDIFISIYSGFFSQQEATQTLARSYGNNQGVLNELYNIVTQMVAVDISILFLLLSVTFGGFYLYWKKSLQYNFLSAGLIAIVLFDLWRINYKPFDAKPHREVQETFAAPDFVKFLKQDSTLYRTLQFENGQPPYDNTLAYWRIQSAYGYQGAKMRQIQDMFDVVGIGNPLLWGLMNVKYIISNQLDSNQILAPVFKGERNIIFNKASLPRTFFVNRYEVAKGLDILTNIKEMKFDPHETAFFMEEPNLKLDIPTAEAKAEYVHYGIQDLEVKVRATGNNLLFLSESWYPEGWKAYIDGIETPIYRINYMFRGVVVPKGEHSLVMKFEPNGFYAGKQISLITNIVIILGLVFLGYKKYFNKKL